MLLNNMVVGSGLTVSTSGDTIKRYFRLNDKEETLLTMVCDWIIQKIDVLSSGLEIYQPQQTGLNFTATLPNS